MEIKKVKGIIKFHVLFDVETNSEGDALEISAPLEFSDLLKKYEYCEVKILNKNNKK